MRPEDFTRQIEQFKVRFDKLETELSDPGVYAVPARASMLARERQRLEGICAECHPFITGKQKLVDVAGRVEKFRRRYQKPAK